MSHLSFVLTPEKKSLGILAEQTKTEDVAIEAQLTFWHLTSSTPVVFNHCSLDQNRAHMKEACWLLIEQLQE